jgi:hypothetical protein
MSTSQLSLEEFCHPLVIDTVLKKLKFSIPEQAQLGDRVLWLVNAFGAWRQDRENFADPISSRRSG